jgi:Zn-dependent peptidase ImmA (M78 family)
MGDPDVTRYPCPLDTSVPVVELPFGDDATTLAFLLQVGDSGVIVLNSNLPPEWNTEAHRNAIFAHELGHLACGVEELAAENWAINRLRDLELDDAAKLLIERELAIIDG